MQVLGLLWETIAVSRWHLDFHISTKIQDLQMRFPRIDFFVRCDKSEFCSKRINANFRSWKDLFINDFIEKSALLS